MPRSRQIRHEFFLNEELASISPHARLLFIGLWLIADRDGRLEDRPARIKAQIFPYEDIDVEAILRELNRRFIARYNVEEEPCIEILKFKKHQHIHPDEKRSIIPKFPGFTGDQPDLDLSSTRTRKSPVISGDLKKPPEITPCSPSPSFSSSPSSSPSPSGKTTATPNGAVDQLIRSIKTDVPPDYNQWRFPRGFNGKYSCAYLVNVPVDECLKLLRTPRLGTKIREALEWRIREHDKTLQEQHRRKS